MDRARNKHEAVEMFSCSSSSELRELCFLQEAETASGVDGKAECSLFAFIPRVAG